MELASLYDTCRTYRRFEQKPVEPELLRTWRTCTETELRPERPVPAVYGGGKPGKCKSHAAPAPVGGSPA